MQYIVIILFAYFQYSFPCEIPPFSFLTGQCINMSKVDDGAVDCVYNSCCFQFSFPVKSHSFHVLWDIVSTRQKSMLLQSIVIILLVVFSSVPL